MNIKKVLSNIIMVTSLMLLTACASTQMGAQEEREVELEVRHISGDVMVFQSFEWLYDWSEHVVRAEVLSQRVDLVDIELFPNDPYMPMTISTIRILEVFSGDLQEGDTTEMWQLGGKYDGVDRRLHVLFSRKIDLPLGEELILFLDVDARDSSLPLSLTSTFQGTYRSISSVGRADSDITQAYYEGTLDAEVVFESVSDDNPLTLTLGELMRITEEDRNRRR